MSNNRLEWHTLLPDTATFTSIFEQQWNGLYLENIAAVQPRLFDSLSQLQRTTAPFPLLLLKNAESHDAQQLLAHVIAEIAPENTTSQGGRYDWNDNRFQFTPEPTADSPFSTLSGSVQIADWIEEEQLFGALRSTSSGFQLQPGLVHQANGGTLILPLRTLLMQPRMWLRLRQMLMQQRFEWLSQDERTPLPISVAPMPLHLRLVLTGDRDALADFQESEPELCADALYSEYEEDWQITDHEDGEAWHQWVHSIAQMHNFAELEADIWPVLFREGVRYTGDQQTLPLSYRWLLRQLRDAQLAGEALNAENLEIAVATREWRESFLAERVQDEILLDQVRIETEGEAVGQINGLSVLEVPGHPRPFGEPSRLSCVVHIGDGEFMDVERKAELGGNLHAKGMMIMQAWLMSELELEQQLPFSASIVFEQSYSEVDGDSASLAELCALISALTLHPIKQSIAVTGSIDQFGNVQSIGGINEKIEGFFNLCEIRGLTGQQGVILPASNVRHLCLKSSVVDAVREGKFHLWAIDSVEEALILLTGKCWQSDDQAVPALIDDIQERISQFNQPDPRHRPWILRWLNWFNHN